MVESLLLTFKLSIGHQNGLPATLGCGSIETPRSHSPLQGYAITLGLSINDFDLGVPPRCYAMPILQISTNLRVTL